MGTGSISLFEFVTVSCSSANLDSNPVEVDMVGKGERGGKSASVSLAYFKTFVE